MNPNIFREFSIRGIADHDLTDEVMIRVGLGIGIFCQRRKIDRLVLGRDVRNSSARISQALITGLLQADINIIDLGLVPTPIHNFATDFYQAGAGVMITASHNPLEYNGLKIRTDRTLHYDELQEIFHLSQVYPQTHSKDIYSNSNSVKRVDPLPTYLEHLKKLASVDQARLKVVIDSGNGANGPAVSQLLTELGLQVVQLNNELNGDFPGRGPDPTVNGALAELVNCVRAEKADVGLAYDGDGDRLALIDEVGNRILGDQIIMILARDILRQGPASIVYEILCTQALADDVIAHGGEPVVTPSGYAFVHQAMLDVGGAIGGELSGHLFFNEPEFRFDDAILATIKLLNVIAHSDKPLSGLVADLPAYYSSPQVRLACPDEVKSKIVDFVRERYQQDYQVDTLDGARIHFAKGWAMVRQSNTQPVISMRFEAHTTDTLKAIQHEVQTFVEAQIKQYTDSLSL